MEDSAKRHRTGAPVRLALCTQSGLSTGDRWEEGDSAQGRNHTCCTLNDGVDALLPCL